MDDSPPLTHSKFSYDSFDSDQHSVSPSPTLAVPQGRDSDRTILMGEVVRLYRERYRLARMHRKAELRVATSLKRRRQSEDGEEDAEEEDDDGHVDWASQANTARAALLEADQTASGQELQYRLLMEDARTKADQAGAQACEAIQVFIQQQRHLVKRSFSALPPEKDRKMTVEELLQKQLQVQEQLQEARAAYFSLAIKKQQQEEELQRRQEANDDQVSVAEMLRLVVETESFTEETGVQESTLLANKAALKTVENLIAKHAQKKEAVASDIQEAEALVDSLRRQLEQKKKDLKELAQKQAESRKKSSSLKPATRLLLDPVLANDLQTKLNLKESLEDELQRLKKACSRKKNTESLG